MRDYETVIEVATTTVFEAIVYADIRDYHELLSYIALNITEEELAEVEAVGSSESIIHKAIDLVDTLWKFKSLDIPVVSRLTFIPNDLLSMDYIPTYQ